MRIDERDPMMLRLLAASALLLTFAAPAVAVSTVCVNPGGTGGCFAAVQAAVDAAGRGTVIQIAAGTYVENVVIPAAAKITLSGAGPTTSRIDGNGSGYVVTIGGGLNTNVTIKGLGIQNGSRGIDVGERVRLTLDSCAVTGNVGEGGVRLRPRSNVTVTGCLVSDNHNPTEVGGGFSFPDYVDPSSRLKIVASTISGNSALNGAGVLSYGDVKIIDSTIAGNSATGDGGGVWANGLTMTGSTVSGNTATSEGGGITGSPFNFRHRFVRVANSTISGNAAGLRGGGVGIVEGMRFEHVTIAGNSAGDKGGGISRTQFLRPTILKGCIVADNVAPNGGADCSSVEIDAFNGNLIESALDCPATLRGGGTILTADPLLGALQNNGGPTETQALAPGSPASGVLTNGALCRQKDQRGVARAVPCDLGAFETP
jgi:hypothetical protein